MISLKPILFNHMVFFFCNRFFSNNVKLFKM